MDILIAHEGQQSGPHSEADALALVKAGKAKITDMAWRPGMGDWLPLQLVLGLAPGEVPAVDPAAETVIDDPAGETVVDGSLPGIKPAKPAIAPASARQKAFLTYLGIPFTTDLSSVQADAELKHARHDAKYAARFKRWDKEKLRLYPDLFAEELKAAKENRPEQYTQACKVEGADSFDGVTKAHAQVLVGFLDVHHPGWDEHDDSVQFFFAAVSEKFPQLVRKSARGQFHYPGGPKIARDLTGGQLPRRRRKPSLVGAVARGVAIGLLVLAALFGAKEYYGHHRSEVNRVLGKWIPLEEPAAEEPAEAPQAVAAEAPTPAPVTKRAPRRKKEVATESKAPAAPQTEGSNAPGEVKPAAAKEAPETPAMAAAATPAPAIPSLFEPAASVPATPAPGPATPAPRTSVKITKATEVPLRFGTSTLPAGTAVSLVSVEGATAVVRFGPDVVRVPVANTDLPAQ